MKHPRHASKRTKLLILLSCGVLSFLGLFIPQAKAQTLIGPNFPISTGTTSEGTPTVAFNPTTNQFLVVYGRAVSGQTVTGQIVNSDGSLSGTYFPIFGSGRFPAVAFNPNNNQFLVVEYGFTEFIEGVMGQLINADGTLNGTQFMISAGRTNSSTTVGNPGIAFNPLANQFLVVWEGFITSRIDIRGQFVNADGTLGGSNFAISSTVGGILNPNVAFNTTSNQFLVVWEGRKDNVPNIFGQLINADGSLDGGQFPISTVSGSKADVAFNPTANQFLVVWSGFSFPFSSGISGQLVNADGTLNSSNFPIFTSTGAGRPAIGFIPLSNRFLVAGNGSGQLVNADGTLSGTSFVIFGGQGSCFTPSPVPGVAFNPLANQFLVVWEKGCDIFGQFVLIESTSLPVLFLSPSSLEFGTVAVGSSKDLNITVQNTGGGTLTGSSITSAPFSIVGSNSFSLTANESKVITVRFSPTSAATFNGNVNFTSNGGNASLLVQGEGVAEQVIVSWTTPPPPSVTSGDSFTVAWSITGASTIDHINVHWDPLDPTAITTCSSDISCSTDSPTSSPATLTAPTVTTPTVLKYAVHASVNGDGIDRFSDVISVTVNPPLSLPTVTWTTPPPSSVTAGQNFTVAWTTTGDPTHVNIHWNPSDPLAPGCCLGTVDTSDSSTVSPTSSPVTLAAPTKHADGTLITAPTTVNYVVHVSNLAGSGNSTVVSVAVNPLEPPGSVPVVLVHGWCGSPTSFGEMARLLGESLTVAEPFDYRLLTQGPSPVTIEELANLFAGHVRNVLETTGATQVDVVAHSMGGLIARAWMAGMSFVPYEGQIRKLIMVGTPNYGAAAAILNDLLILGPCSETQAEQMRFGSNFVWDLNENWRVRVVGENRIPTDNIFVIAGTQSAEQCDLPRCEGDDDGVVNIASAALPNHQPNLFLPGDQIRYVPYRHFSLVPPFDGTPTLVGVFEDRHCTFRLVRDFLTERQVPEPCDGYIPPTDITRRVLMLVRLVDKATQTPIDPSVLFLTQIFIDGTQFFPLLNPEAGTMTVLDALEDRGHTITIQPPSGYKQPEPLTVFIQGGRPTVLPAIELELE